MGLLARMLREALVLDVEHWRRCPDCNGSGEKHEALRGPNGVVPNPRVIARIQCDRCKGKGKFLVYEQHRERGKQFVREYKR